MWHPFTQHSLWNQVEPLIIVGGEGEFVIDAEGRRYIDGHSSLWCNIHGHRRPEIDAAIVEQLGRVAHTTLLGLASPPAVHLAERLVALAPPGLTKVFYSDDGSTSVEVACKLAYGYWHHQGRPERRKFVALRNAYHGDTIGSVSVGGIDLFHHVYKPLLFETHFVASPYCYRCPERLQRAAGLSPRGCATGENEPRDPCCDVTVDELVTVLENKPGEIAAVIVEPLVQCAGGIITAPAGQLRQIRELCDSHDVLLIADEVATGFGRTGRMFACEHEDVSPDLMCLSKGLTGGYLPLGATLATKRIYDAFLGPIDSERTFYHGHTFTGNPLACAAALACLDIFETDRTLEQLAPKIDRLTVHVRRIAESVHVGDVRQCGFIAGIEIVRDKRARRPYPYAAQVGAQICHRARDYGVIVRPLADTIVVMPPLSIAMENLDRLMDAVEKSIEEVMVRMHGGTVDGLE